MIKIPEGINQSNPVASGRESIEKLIELFVTQATKPTVSGTIKVQPKGMGSSIVTSVNNVSQVPLLFRASNWYIPELRPVNVPLGCHDPVIPNLNSGVPTPPVAEMVIEPSEAPQVDGLTSASTLIVKASG